MVGVAGKGRSWPGFGIVYSDCIGSGLGIGIGVGTVTGIGLDIELLGCRIERLGCRIGIGLGLDTARSDSEFDAESFGF